MAPSTAAVSPREVALERRLDELEQRQRLLEQKLELERSSHDVLAKEPPRVSIGPRGFAIESADGAFQLRIRGLFQADGRAYLANPAISASDTFLIRRAMPILEARLFKIVDLRFMPDFGQGKLVLYDAYIDIHPFSWLRIRGGKFNPGIGLERLQCMANLTFVELGLPNAIVPIRDVGAQLWGEVANGAFLYAFAVFNGVTDGTVGDFDTGDGVDFVGRIFAHPFRPLKISAVENLGIGFAASYGNQNGTPASTNLPSYKSIGQQVFFSYLVDPKPDATNTVVPRGEHYRLAPQFYYYVGPLGLLGEYVYVAQSVQKDTSRAVLSHQAWQIQLSFVLTLDRASYDGVIPKRPFDLKKRHFGALELAGRYNELRVDKAAFPVFADVTKSAYQARSFGVALNWYLTANTRFGINYERSDFKGGSPTGNRNAENVLFGRLQVSF